MCGTAVLLVIKIRGKEVYVKGLNVAASCSSEHGLESAIAPAVTLERKDLHRDGKRKTKSPTAVRNKPGARTLPLSPISALRCEVLFPGAAVASMITLLGCAGGASTTAGKQDALSWRMRRPSEYSGVSVSSACGGNNRRFSTCASRVKFLRVGGGGGETCR